MLHTRTEYAITKFYCSIKHWRNVISSVWYPDAGRLHCIAFQTFSGQRSRSVWKPWRQSNDSKCGHVINISDWILFKWERSSSPAELADTMKDRRVFNKSIVIENAESAALSQDRFWHKRHLSKLNVSTRKDFRSQKRTEIEIVEMPSFTVDYAKIVWR